MRGIERSEMAPNVQHGGLPPTTPPVQGPASVRLDHRAISLRSIPLIRPYGAGRLAVRKRGEGVNLGPQTIPADATPEAGRSRVFAAR